MIREGRETTLEAIDWARLVRPGDLVAWGQSCAEPVALTKSLVESRAAIGGFRAFVGISNSPNVDPKYTDHVAFSSYCGTGNNQRLGDQLDILPIHYGKLVAALGREAPVVLLSLACGCDADHFSYGAAGDYLGDLVHRARLVIAEVSDRVPRTGSGADLRRDQIDLVVRSSSVPPEPVAARIGTTEQAVAAQVAGLIENGSTLQIGLGAIPAAVLRALSGHRDLGIHSGLIGDEVADLAEAGVISNARKTVDRGLSVAGLLVGGPRLMRWADHNPTLALRPTSYTHDHSVLASIDLLVAVSTARADVGLVVTEHGVADLRGLSLRARREKMLSIADPAHCSALDAGLFSSRDRQ